MFKGVVTINPCALPIKRYEARQPAPPGWLPLTAQLDLPD